MRKSTPQPAAKGSKQHKRNWTKTWDANVHYRHNAAGEISFATRTYNKGKKASAKYWNSKGEEVETHDEARE